MHLLFRSQAIFTPTPFILYVRYSVEHCVFPFYPPHHPPSTIRVLSGVLSGVRNRHSAAVIPFRPFFHPSDLFSISRGFFLLASSTFSLRYAPSYKPSSTAYLFLHGLALGVTRSARFTLSLRLHFGLLLVSSAEERGLKLLPSQPSSCENSRSRCRQNKLSTTRTRSLIDTETVARRVCLLE